MDLEYHTQLDFISHMPKWFLKEENEQLCRLVTEEELVDTMKETTKEKIPGPDNWGVELFIHFAELMIPNLLTTIEESRIKGLIPGAINSIFIALIPKRKMPQTFVDLRAISLCNTMYKLISKVITRRFKPILSKFILEEQFGFIEGRQIHDAIGIA